MWDLFSGPVLKHSHLIPHSTNGKLKNTLGTSEGTNSKSVYQDNLSVVGQRT